MQGLQPRTFVCVPNYVNQDTRLSFLYGVKSVVVAVLGRARLSVRSESDVYISRVAIALAGLFCSQVCAPAMNAT